MLFALAAAASATGDEARFSAAGFARKLREAGIDPEACYRVRELNFNKEDIRFYLTDGYLAFGRPVDGRRYQAVFAADATAGDAEILVFPPSSSERQSLAAFAKAPNLNEHFLTGVFIFTDRTAEELLQRLQSAGAKKAPEAGLLMAGTWGPVVRNLSESFEIRLVRDAASGGAAPDLFFAALTGRTLGNFDVVYDRRAREEITLGQVVHREGRSFFDVWTSFPARSSRNARRPPPERDFRVEDLRIEAELDPQLRLKAVTRAKLVTDSAPERALAFDISRSMRVRETRIDGVPVETFQRESLRANILRSMENELFLAIPHSPLDPKRTYEIEFHHDGEVVSSAGNGVYYVGARGTWYPNRGVDFANYDITFRYPKTLSLVATGDVIEDRTEGEWRITRRRTSSPIRFAGFNLGDYEKISAAAAGLKVEVYANRKVEGALQPRPRDLILTQPPIMQRSRRQPPDTLSVPLPQAPPDPRARLSQMAGEIASALEFMAGRFGPPPLKTLTVSPIPGVFGQGFPGLVYLSTLSYLDAQQRPAAARDGMQALFFSDLLHAHETAHQWWGNLVTTDAPGDLWLMEALANYSALMHLEKRRGRKVLDSVMDKYREHLLTKDENGRTVESAGPITRGLRLRSSLSPMAWRTITYEKGAWILHMLRARMGDEKFNRMLGEIVRRYRYQTFTTQAFQAMAQEFGAVPTEGFFDHWVHGAGVPELKLAYTMRGTRLRGTVTQTLPDEEASIEVPVEIQLAGKKTILHWVRTSAEPAAFSIDLKDRPLRVSLGPVLRQ